MPKYIGCLISRLFFPVLIWLFYGAVAYMMFLSVLEMLRYLI